MSVRTFLAVEVAPDVHAALVALKHDLARHGADVRWVRDENLHATVKFLGAVAEERLPLLRAALITALGSTPPAPAQIAGLGAFPHLRRPRVLWAGVRCAALSGIAATVDRAVAPLGFAAETRPYHAHITLGRVETLRGWPALDAAVQARAGADVGSCTLPELVAFRSDLRRDGAVYTKLWTIPFGG